MNFIKYKIIRTFFFFNSDKRIGNLIIYIFIIHILIIYYFIIVFSLSSKNIKFEKSKKEKFNLYIYKKKNLMI